MISLLSRCVMEKSYRRGLSKQGLFGSSFDCLLVTDSFSDCNKTKRAACHQDPIVSDGFKTIKYFTVDARIYWWVTSVMTSVSELHARIEAKKVLVGCSIESFSPGYAEMAGMLGSTLSGRTSST